MGRAHYQWYVPPAVDGRPVRAAPRDDGGVFSTVATAPLAIATGPSRGRIARQHHGSGRTSSDRHGGNRDGRWRRHCRGDEHGLPAMRRVEAVRGWLLFPHVHDQLTRGEQERRSMFW
jgi:hypothetical protein